MLLEIEHRLAFDYDAIHQRVVIMGAARARPPKSTSDQTVSSFMLSVGRPPRAPLHGLERQHHPHFTITRSTIASSCESLAGQHAPDGAAIAAVAMPAAVPRRALPLLDSWPSAGPGASHARVAAAHKAAAPGRPAPLGEHVLALGGYLAKALRVPEGRTKVDSTTEDFLKIGAGVCQDFAT